MPAPNLMAIHHVKMIHLVCTRRKSRGIKYVSVGFILWEQWMFSQSFMPINQVEMEIFHGKSGKKDAKKGRDYQNVFEAIHSDRLTIGIHVSVVWVTKNLFVGCAASKMILWKLYLTLQSSHQQQWILGLLRWLVHNGGTTFSKASVMFWRH